MGVAIEQMSSGGRKRQCNATCHNAKKPKCHCICHGRNHGCGSLQEAMKRNEEAFKDVQPELFERLKDGAIRIKKLLDQ